MISKGEVYLLKNGTIARIVEETHPDTDYHTMKDIKCLKLRCISSPSKRYTYQRYSTIPNFKKKIKRRIGTEELLQILYEVNKND